MNPSPTDPATDSATHTAPISDLPPSLRSLRRTVSIGYRAEPRLLVVSFVMMIFTALPDALLALWLGLLADGVLNDDRGRIVVAAIGLGVSSTLTWYLRVVFDRVQRRFRDKVSIALESHVARLQANVATIEHHERPEYLDRLSVLRDQVFALDHLFMSLFSTLGWIVRLLITIILLATIHPVLVLLAVFAVPTVMTSTWRPAVERAVEERVAPHNRLARHLFVVGTSAAPGKEARVTGITESLVTERRAAWDQWYTPVAHARWVSALWQASTWSVFGLAYVGTIVFVASGLDESAGAVLLTVAAGSRLSQYVGAAAGELGFLRGIWLDSSRRLTWLEDYSDAVGAHANADVPDLLTDGIRFCDVSFRYPGTERMVLEGVDIHLPAGAVVAVVGENGAGKTTLVKLLARMYAPDSGRIEVDGVDLATIDPQQWRSRLAGAFQDFFKFEFRAQRTVGLGDLPRRDDRPAVESAVDRAGADDVVDRLTYGLDTQLGPTWDEGVEVSFGQWQKLALARGFMRDQPLVLILDEPTAALDAETEHALFERYASESRAPSAGGGTHDRSGTGSTGTLPPTGSIGASAGRNGRVTILVSHRFSTVRMADLIVVLDGSRVVEVGSHEELMARRGQYAELYEIQAGSFR